MLKRKPRISARDLRYLLVFVTISTIITSSAAYLTLNPTSSEQFFAMWILGSKDVAEHYYPNDNPNVLANSTINWTLQVYNHMNSVQYVLVRVKIANSTTQSPDDSKGEPSHALVLLEFSRVLLDNETWKIPFNWTILNASQEGPSVDLTGLSINDASFKGRLATALSGFNYRFIFELWVYNLATNAFSFSWMVKNSQHSVWNEMWFNATLPDLLQG